MNADKYVKRKNDVPTEPHWAILTFSSVYIPGDERSRTNPGHGYPAETKPIVEYEVYLTEDKWKKKIQMLVSQHENNFVAIRVDPAKIEQHVIVT